MADSWKKQCDAKKIPLDRVAEVLDLLEKDGRYDPSRGETDATSERAVHFGSDSTAPNGSSIAMLLETHGYRLLLTGDAQPDLLAESIRQLAEDRKELPLRIDAFKLAHHGSQGNITPELLDLIDCDLFLVSSNGDHFQHPDHATIELIASRAHGRQPRVIFNYRSAYTQGWADDARICAEYGADGHSVVKLVSDIVNNAYGPLT